MMFNPSHIQLGYVKWLNKREDYQIPQKKKAMKNKFRRKSKL